MYNLVGTVEPLLEVNMELPKYCRLTLIPILMILVIPFYVYIPQLQQQQILDLVNETVQAVRNGS